MMQKVGRLSKAESRECKSSARRFFRNILFIGGLELAALAFPRNSYADETQRQPKTSLGVKFMAGAYHKGKDPFAGLGLAGSLDYRWLKIDLSENTIFQKFEYAKLDSAKLDLTFRVNDYFSVGPFGYRSIYYGDVPWALGVAFHIPKFNLHAAPHYIGGGAVPLPVSWTPTIGKRLKLMFKITPQMRHIITSIPGPFVGGEIGITFALWDRISLFWKSFMMTIRNKEGKTSAGTANTQAGVEINF